jgi:hypothetical protein
MTWRAVSGRPNLGAHGGEGLLRQELEHVAGGGGPQQAVRARAGRVAGGEAAAALLRRRAVAQV